MYYIEIWERAAGSHHEILQRFRSKMLRIIFNAPDNTIQRDIPVATTKETIAKSNSLCKMRKCKDSKGLNQQIFVNDRRVI